MTAAQVQLKVDVWPLYIGVTVGNPLNGHVVEPGSDYQRGNIIWERRDDGQVFGRARIYAPKGVYNYYAFYSGPQPGADLMGIVEMPHPIVFDRAGIIDVDPIHNRDIMPRGT